MAELVAGSLLSAVIDVMVENLHSFDLNIPIIKKLKTTLLSANSLLNDVEDKQLKNVNVKSWVDRLNEVLNDADNVIDDIKTEALRREIEGKALLKKLLPNSFNGMERKQKLEKIIERLELVLDEKDGLEEGGQSKMPRAPLIEDSSDVYGRDAAKEAIVQLLVSENYTGGQDKISVIPIVGMGGVGKTTLARLVYNDNRVKDRFEHRAWVTVSDDFDVLRIAKLFYKALSGKDYEVKELGKLREELEKFLGRKKFFLVLDDVWNENYTLWNSLKSVLQVGADGSKIIVTTRSEHIGSTMGSVPSHYLTPWSEHDSWMLFQELVFRSGEDCPKQLETIGRKIVKKCRGLPLAVVSVAGFLRSVSDPREWENIRDSDIWETERKGDDEIPPFLWISYRYLPPNVKRCFAYWSIFPKGFNLEKEKIMLWWMAEGLVQGENDGEEYLKTLVSRSFLERSPEDESTFHMQNLMHDFATFVSGKNICITLHLNKEIATPSDPRHALVDFHLDSAWQIPDSFSKLKQLRTLILNSQSRWDVEGGSGDLVCEIITKLRFLRMLDLHNSGIKVVPSSIGKLKHLRYLDLSRNVNLKELPKSITSLCNLQTLKLNNCSNLRALPRDFGKLVNLRYLENESCYSLTHMPQGLGKLSNLQRVSEFVLTVSTTIGRSGNLDELKNLNELSGRLKIKNLRCPDRDGTKDALLKDKEHLRSLVLIWDIEASTDHEKSLEDLRPHKNLQELCLSSYGGVRFSSWLPSHVSLVEIALLKCTKCEYLPALDFLPSLRVLRVDELAELTHISEEESEVFFPSLRELELKNLPKLEQWWKHPGNVEDKTFPILSKLVIEDCPKLTSMPRFPGLEEQLVLKNTKWDPFLQTVAWSGASSSSSSSLSTLRTLSVVNMSGGDDTICKSLPGLRALTLDHIPEIEPILKALQQITSLKELSILRCDGLKEISGWISSIRSLTSLTIRLCPNMKIPSDQISLITCLQRVEIENCPMVRHIEGMIKDHLYRS